jgi:hypothetical protein
LQTSLSVLGWAFVQKFYITRELPLIEKEQNECET